MELAQDSPPKMGRAVATNSPGWPVATRIAEAKGPKGHPTNERLPTWASRSNLLLPAWLVAQSDPRSIASGRLPGQRDSDSPRRKSWPGMEIRCFAQPFDRSRSLVLTPVGTSRTSRLPLVRIGRDGGARRDATATAFDNDRAPVFVVFITR